MVKWCYPSVRAATWDTFGAQQKMRDAETIKLGFWRGGGERRKKLSKKATFLGNPTTINF